jgi:hypothetical protein
MDWPSYLDAISPIKYMPKSACKYEALLNNENTTLRAQVPGLLVGGFHGCANI